MASKKPTWLSNLEAKDTPAVSKSTTLSGGGGGTNGAQYIKPAGLGVDVRVNPSTSVFSNSTTQSTPTQVSGNTYSPTYGNYTIGSDYGKSIANNMPVGVEWNNPNDGSTWYKNADGTMKVTHDGVVTNNAYQAQVYNPTAGSYRIGSELGISQAQGMPIGSTSIGSDGSFWKKEADGSATVYHNGTVTKNAYTPTPGNYSITSDFGVNRANEMAIGEEWIATDGSKWKKNADGTISVTHNGITTQNAYRQGDLGTLGLQQMEAGLDWRDVMATYLARQNKANSAEGLQQYANDEVAQQMWNYIMEGMKREYRPEQTGQEILEYYNGNQPTYEDQYDPKIQALLDNILSREDFSYDANDPLYQQYAKSYRREGDRAMSETMAEAAASAGGMNSYAITAAQQANNYYGSQLNDKIPELYHLAYQMYLDDKESDIQDLGVLQNMSDREYSRFMDTMDEWRNDRDFAYGIYRDDVADGMWNQQFDYNAMTGERDYNYGVSQDFLSNEWREREWNRIQEESAYEKSQYADELAYERAQAEKLDAYNRVVDAVANGASLASIGTELIQQAGLSTAIVKDWITKRDSENFSKASSGNGGGSRKSSGGSGSSSSSSGGSPVANTSGWTSIAGDLGIPAVTSASYIKEMKDAGAIYEDANGTVKWSDGWNSKNYEEKMKKVGYLM